MIVEYIRYRVAPARAAELLAAYERATEPLAASPHCLDFELARCREDPERFVLRIRWDSFEGHVDGFRGSEEFRRFLHEVQPFIVDVEEMQHYEPALTAVGAGTGEPPTLYEWAGGADAFERLFVHFYGEVATDDLLGPVFAGMDPEHPRHVAAWLGEVFGGPSRYTDELGGYEAMLAHHVGLAITEAQRRRWVSLLLDAADAVDLPADPEFRAAFAGYLEWGTRLAVANSAPGARPVAHAPVPRWGWGVAPPFTG